MSRTWPEVRRRLGEELRTDAELVAFCHDCFPAAHRQLTGGMTRIQKESTLIELADRAPEEVDRELTQWLQRRAKGPRPETAPPPGRRLPWALGGAAVLVILLLGALLWRAQVAGGSRAEAPERPERAERAERAEKPSPPPVIRAPEPVAPVPAAPVPAAPTLAPAAAGGLSIQQNNFDHATGTILVPGGTAGPAARKAP